MEDHKLSKELEQAIWGIPLSNERMISNRRPKTLNFHELPSGSTVEDSGTGF